MLGYNETYEAVHATENLEHGGDDLEAKVFRLISARAGTPGVARHLLAHFPDELLDTFATDATTAVAAF